MRARRFLVVPVFIAWAAAAFAFEMGVSAGAGVGTETPNAFYPYVDFIVEHDAGDLDFFWDLGLTGDGTYGAMFGDAYGMGGVTPLIREGFLSWSSGNLFLSFGKSALKDEVDSPYSLVLSSLGNAALNAHLRYEDEGFFYSDRWIALNYDSSNTVNYWDGTTYQSIEWPDRSAVIKSYGFKAGEIRFGFQDIAIFTDLYYGSAQRGPLFDASYFLIPAPSFLIQYARMSVDSPWQTVDGLNDNSIMAFFLEWRRGKIGALAQVLVDDFNLNRFIHPSDYQNPDKLAWTFGGSLETVVGTFRFDQAGATKYMFEASGYGGIDNLMYSYTFYPDTEYLLDGAETAIDLESNYLGYYHGENNVAFMLSWKKLPGGPLDLAGGLEFSMSGSKSPANPWHEYTSWSQGGEGAKWLDEDVLEKKVLLAATASYPLGDFRLFASGTLGYVWNRLKLTSVYSSYYTGYESDDDYEIKLYKPSSENAFIGSLTLGAKWSWSPRR